jgi:hypothetical protein
MSIYCRLNRCARGAIPTVYPQVAAQAPSALLKYLSIFKSHHVSELLSEAILQSLRCEVLVTLTLTFDTI